MSRFLPLVTSCVFFSAIGGIQAQTGTIQGTVNDSGGGTVPNASVKAIDQAKNIVARETTTNREGIFAITPLLPGQYTLRIEAPGFKASNIKNITLDQTQILNLGVVPLELGQVADSVSVESLVTAVETTTAQKSFVISSKEVTEIPLNGRDFQSLMRTLPGVGFKGDGFFAALFESASEVRAS